MAKSKKIVTIILWGIVLISVILMISLMSNINTENEADPSMLSWISTNLTWTYILFAITALIVLFFGIIQMFSEKKALLNGLMVMGFFAVIILVAYLFTDNSMPTFLGVNKFIEDGTLTPKVSRLIGVGLNTTYILFILAIGSVLWSSLSRLFK